MGGGGGLGGSGGMPPPPPPPPEIYWYFCSETAFGTICMSEEKNSCFIDIDEPIASSYTDKVATVADIDILHK